MIIQVPEHFSQNKDILRVENLSIMYYFNRKKSEKIHVQINKHMLLHIFNGSKIIYSDDLEHIVSDKQSIFISSGQYFMSELLSVEKSHFDGIMVFFDDAFLVSFFHKYQNLRQQNITSIPNTQKLCIIEDSSSLHETMLSAKSYLERKSDAPTLIQLKLEEIFLQLLQSNSSDEIFKYFQTLYASSLFTLKKIFETKDFGTVDEMIKERKLSEVQFRKLFRQMYDSTPKEWLLRKSLDKAKGLLSNQELNVTEVCYECGFNSLSWFIKSFKKEFGLTPKKYQQNC